MKKEKTGNRIKQIMKEKNLKQSDIIKLCEPISNKYKFGDGKKVKISKSDLSQWIGNKYEPGQWKLTILSEALQVDPAWLMGYDVPMKSKNLSKIDKNKYDDFISKYNYKELIEELDKFTLSDILEMLDNTQLIRLIYQEKDDLEKIKFNIDLLIQKLSTITKKSYLEDFLKADFVHSLKSAIVYSYLQEKVSKQDILKVLITRYNFKKNNDGSISVYETKYNYNDDSISDKEKLVTLENLLDNSNLTERIKDMVNSSIGDENDENILKEEINELLTDNNNNNKDK